ncbi:hypothetical protein CANCADRAFT_493 [Tortispora caseinolytica NRRL Y-17796]|uniref:Chromatin assembly factor 1 subunit p150 C-terminal domain-containing protein n=1 Tax=Tortispora caseinolytica NRRL Y-17796 TaxID=767744 RepID=A0A1E4TJH2_9ASCO|nr:hypothetical protein CANCADRAFT_493 [Tortispora caseinolytica NRRL Y-17796]
MEDYQREVLAGTSPVSVLFTPQKIEEQAKPMGSANQKQETGGQEEVRASTPQNTEKHEITDLCTPQSSAKRVKLYPGEREAAQRERDRLKREKEEQRERERLRKEEEKQKREAEKAEERQKREEEKQKREAEKAEEKRKREEERQKREEARKQKLEEKRLKEEAAEKAKMEEEKAKGKQLKLGSFFVAKKRPAISSVLQPSSVGGQNSSEQASDYHKTFRRFVIHSTMTFKSTSDVIARLTEDDIKRKRDTIDELLTCPSKDHSLDEMRKDLAANLQKSGVDGKTYKLNGLPACEIHEITEACEEQNEASRFKSKMPLKYFEFSENFRPPYFGTFSKLPVNFRRGNPFFRDPALAYDIDSDWEWHQEDGEDIMSDSEGEGTDAEDSDESMDEFVEEDSSKNVKRRNVVSALDPVIEGVYFENLCTQEHSVFAERGMRMEILSNTITLPIDPYKDYWTAVKETERQPSGSSSQIAPDSKASPSGSTDTDALLKGINNDDIPALLQFIHQSKFTKSLLVELTKQKFPMLSKATIGSIIKDICVREDKLWKVRPEVFHKYIKEPASALSADTFLADMIQQS